MGMVIVQRTMIIPSRNTEIPSIDSGQIDPHKLLGFVVVVHTYDLLRLRIGTTGWVC